MTILGTEVARRVAIDVLCVDICAMLNQTLDNTQVASKACNMQWGTEVVGAGVNLCAELDEDFDQGCVALTGSQVERCEAVAVGAVDHLVNLVVLVVVLLGKGQNLDHLVPIALVDLGPVVHFDFFQVFFPLSDL